MGLALAACEETKQSAYERRLRPAGEQHQPWLGRNQAELSAADTLLGTVLAYFPLTSPLMMPFRIALGEAGWVEIVGSLALLVLSIALAARVGSTIYSRAIVRTGRKLTLREALSSS